MVCLPCANNKPIMSFHIIHNQPYQVASNNFISKEVEISKRSSDLLKQQSCCNIVSLTPSLKLVPCLINRGEVRIMEGLVWSKHQPQWMPGSCRPYALPSVSSLGIRTWRTLVGGEVPPPTRERRGHMERLEQWLFSNKCGSLLLFSI